jgi:hypothetical protein
MVSSEVRRGIKRGIERVGRGHRMDKDTTCTILCLPLMDGYYDGAVKSLLPVLWKTNDLGCHGEQLMLRQDEREKRKETPQKNDDTHLLPRGMGFSMLLLMYDLEP